ncbi:VanZ family protein [Jeotgalibaca sp. MA1X17-3]|uniref:VanZ family protein n=1 Tax=Jeotgalibaca sp. MA1X17-3 TaxID=2908211 RepID=UPI001F36528F|nr:VanZ family protein [Jeotgalibaca sp. MA1X17-3]UJF15643.1 VanZ family protein [Jeotgalibaca sp. MA1X17-3]
MRKKQLWSWGMVGIWMTIIFLFSAQQGSSSGSLSTSVLNMVSSTWAFIFPSLPFDEQYLHLFIRKGAHFSVYFILGGLVSNAFRTSGVSFKKQIGYAFIFSTLYAASDEFHQSFVPGRGPSIVDVGIDSVGAAVGIFFYHGTRKIILPLLKK